MVGRGPGSGTSVMDAGGSSAGIDADVDAPAPSARMDGLGGSTEPTRSTSTAAMDGAGMNTLLGRGARGGLPINSLSSLQVPCCGSDVRVGHEEP